MVRALLKIAGEIETEIGEGIGMKVGAVMDAEKPVFGLSWPRCLREKSISRCGRMHSSWRMRRMLFARGIRRGRWLVWLVPPEQTAEMEGGTQEIRGMGGEVPRIAGEIVGVNLMSPNG